MSFDFAPGACYVPVVAIFIATDLMQHPAHLRAQLAAGRMQETRMQLFFLEVGGGGDKTLGLQVCPTSNSQRENSCCVSVEKSFLLGFQHNSFLQ